MGRFGHTCSWRSATIYISFPLLNFRNIYLFYETIRFGRFLDYFCPFLSMFGHFKTDKKRVRRSTNPNPDEIERFIFSLYVNTHLTPKTQRRATIQSKYELQSTVQSDDFEFRTSLRSSKRLKKVVKRTLSTIEDAFAKSSKALGRTSISALKRTLSVQTENRLS